MVAGKGKGLVCTGKGKEPMGSEDSFFSADSELSPVEDSKMNIDTEYGLGGRENKGACVGSNCRRARKKIKTKAAEKIIRERARRSKVLSKKKLDWMGSFWEKLKITEPKKKAQINPMVGDKLETIEEDSEDWVPLKIRCKVQKCFKGRNKFKYGLSGSDDISTSSVETICNKGVVAGPDQPQRGI